MGRLENKLARAILSKDAKTIKKLTCTKPVANHSTITCMCRPPPWNMLR